MKKWMCLLFAALCGLGLSGCGCGDGGEADLVFVNDSDSIIVTVVVDSSDHASGTMNADSSPLKRGESFGFEVGDYPATVLVYDRAVGDVEEKELASIKIGEAPAEGDRWYIIARDGGNGLVLTADTHWQSGV